MSGLPRPWRVLHHSTAEMVDYFVYLGSDVPEAEDEDWPFSVAERYLHGEARLHVHVRRRAAMTSDTTDLCGIVVAAAKAEFATPFRRERHLDIAQASSGWHFVSQLRQRYDDRLADLLIEGTRGDSRVTRMDVPMLVYIVEVGEQGERMPPRPVHSTLERLTLLDECEVFRRYAVGLPSGPRRSVRLRRELGSIFIDRELVLAGHGYRASGNDELPEQVIESGSEQMREDADLHPMAFRGQPPRYAQDVFTGVRLFLSDHSAAFDVEKVYSFSLDEVQVLVSLNELEVDSSQSVRHVQ